MKAEKSPQCLVHDVPVPALRQALHEIGNSIHVIAGRANRLKNKLEGNELAEYNLSVIIEQSEKVGQTLEEIRNLLLCEDQKHDTRLQTEGG